MHNMLALNLRDLDCRDLLYNLILGALPKTTTSGIS